MWTALIVTAQLGVPAAVVKLGVSQGVLHPGQGAAIIVAALVSLGVCAAGTGLAKRAIPDPQPAASGPGGPAPAPSGAG